MGERLTSRQNDRVRHAKKLAESAEYRRQCGEFLAEGGKLYREALNSGIEIVEVFTCGDAAGYGAGVTEVTRELIEYISPMKTPQDILFTGRIPAPKDITDLNGAIIIENIQDPGNIGTILRTAGAFGISAVVLVGDCADPWSTKTIRASMGAVFRQPICRVGLHELKARLGEVRLYGAALSEKSQDIRSVSLNLAAVAIGNEGNGLSEELLALCDGQLIIPMMPEAESLNAAVAAGIVMWEMRGRLI